MDAHRHHAAAAHPHLRHPAQTGRSPSSAVQTATHATKPLAGLCDSSRCPQATHHPCHRPVGADSASTKQAFIESIGRGHKTEKVRLQADLERDLKVLAAIDATA
jgi:hypothetical protein